MTVETITSLSEVSASEEQNQLATYKKMPIVAARGEGVWLYSSEGEKYLDLYGGHAVAGTGHCHPHVVEAIQQQSAQLLFYSNLVYSETRARAAEKLISVAPKPLAKVFFCNSGTEANENAMRIARMNTGREKIITFSVAFMDARPTRLARPSSERIESLGNQMFPVTSRLSSATSNQCER
jgi:4-aminobutyrate aminotransferase-like enzyme